MAINKIMNIILRMKGAKKAKQDLKGVGGGLKSLAKKAATAAAGFFAVTKAMESVKLAGKFEGVKRGFDNLTKSVGFSTSTFDKLKRATDGTVKSMELMELANNAMLLGIFDSEDQMAKTFDVAQRLASALGKDARYGVESLVTGLGRQSKLMLDNLGIVFDVNKAYDEYAATLGVTASELTDAQKKQAFVNKALSEADTLVSNLGDEQLTTADTFSRAGAGVEEFTIAMGEMLAPIVEIALPAINKLVSAMQKIPYMQMPKAVKEDAIAYANMMRSHAAGYTETMVALAKKPERLKILLGVVNEQLDMMNKRVAEQAGYGLVVDPVIDNYNQLAASIKDLIGIQETSEGATKKAITHTIKEGQWLSHLSDIYKVSVEDIKEWNGMTSDSVKEGDKLIVGFEKTIKTITPVVETYKSWVKALEDKQALNEQESGWTTQLIEENYELAEAMGFVNTEGGFLVETFGRLIDKIKEHSEETYEASYSWDTFKENLDQAAASSILTAANITSTSDAMGAASDAAKKAAGTFISAEIQKAVATWITSMLKSAGAAAWLIAPIAIAGGAAFGSLMGSAISRNFAQGGLVGGQGSGDTVPAMLTPGEFVLSRSAVQDIGVDTAQRINQGGGAGITVNINAPLVDETVRDSIIPAIQKAQRLNLA